MNVTVDGVTYSLAPAKKTHAQLCYCEKCNQWLGCQYWPLAKSAALHERGTGHKVKFYVWKICGGCCSNPCQCKSMVMVAHG